MMARIHVAFVMLLASGTAFAQSSDELELTEDGGFVITGEVQKPDVVVFIDRQNVEQGFELELKESFLDRIIEVLDEDLF